MWLSTAWSIVLRFLRRSYTWISTVLPLKPLLPPTNAIDEEAGSGTFGAQSDGSYYLQGEWLSSGVTGVVELLPNGTVLKAPKPGDDTPLYRSEIEFESRIYDLLGQHPRLITKFSLTSDGLILEYMHNGSLAQYLQDHHHRPTTTIDAQTRLQWAIQAAEAIRFLHSHDIIHCDINPRNFLLDSDLNVKVIDFSGSSFGDHKGTACEGVRYCRPRHWKIPSTKQTDLFALGSTLYHILTGMAPFADVDSDEVERRFEGERFPDLEGVVCADVVRKCWVGEVESADEVWNMLVRESVDFSKNP